MAYSCAYLFVFIFILFQLSCTNGDNVTRPVPLREKLLLAFNEQSLSAQNASTDRFESWERQSRKDTAGMLAHTIQLEEQINELRNRQSALLNASKMSKELNAALLQERIAESAVHVQYTKCRDATAELDRQLETHSGRISTLKQSQASITELSHGHGLHIAESGDMVLFQKEGTVDDHPEQAIYDAVAEYKSKISGAYSSASEAANINARASRMERALAPTNDRDFFSNTEQLENDQALLQLQQPNLQHPDMELPVADPHNDKVPMVTTHPDRSGQIDCDGPLGCGGHERVGELLSEVMSASSVAIASLRNRRETLLQPCQRKLASLQENLRGAQRAAKELKSKRVNNTAEVQMLADTILSLKELKSQASKHAKEMQSRIMDRAESQRQRTGSRQVELDHVDSLSTLFAVTVDMAEREREAQRQVADDELAALQAILMAEFMDRKAKCDHDIGVQVGKLERAFKLQAMLEDLLAFISSAETQGDGAGEQLLLSTLVSATAADTQVSALLQVDAHDDMDLSAQAGKVRDVIAQRIAKAQSELDSVEQSCAKMLQELNVKMMRDI